MIINYHLLQLKVVDFNSQIAKFGQPGEICIKLVGDSKFLGYYKDSKATSKYLDEEEWVHTGYGFTVII